MIDTQTSLFDAPAPAVESVPNIQQMATPSKRLPPPPLEPIARPGYSRETGAPFTESTTSKAAAEAIAVETIRGRTEEVLQAVRSHGPIAAFAIAERLGVPQHWITSCVKKLLEKGLIEKLEQTAINPESGKSCRLLRATGVRR